MRPSFSSFASYAFMQFTTRLPGVLIASRYTYMYPLRIPSIRPLSVIEALKKTKCHLSSCRGAKAMLTAARHQTAWPSRPVDSYASTDGNATGYVITTDAVRNVRAFVRPSIMRFWKSCTEKNSRAEEECRSTFLKCSLIGWSVFRMQHIHQLHFRAPGPRLPLIYYRNTMMSVLPRESSFLCQKYVR